MNPYNLAKQWDNLRLRISTSAKGKLRNNEGGFAIVHVSMFLNHKGELVAYTEPACKRLEPSNMDWMSFLFGAD